MKRYSFDDLLWAYIDLQSFGQPSGQSADFYREKYQALSRLFNVDLEKEWWRFGIEEPEAGYALLLQRLSRFYNEIRHPNDRVLECPRSYAEFSRKYNARLVGHVRDYRATIFEMLRELARQIYGDRQQEFTSEDLKAVGFDDSNEPEPFEP